MNWFLSILHTYIRIYIYTSTAATTSTATRSTSSTKFNTNNKLHYPTPRGQHPYSAKAQQFWCDLPKQPYAEESYRP